MPIQASARLISRTMFDCDFASLAPAFPRPLRPGDPQCALTAPMGSIFFSGSSGRSASCGRLASPLSALALAKWANGKWASMLLVQSRNQKLASLALGFWFRPIWVIPSWCGHGMASVWCGHGAPIRILGQKRRKYFRPNNCIGALGPSHTRPTTGPN